MSLYTCCPACGTTFRLLPDQLKISQGWVRCGYCTQVFDAPAHLQPAPPSSEWADSELVFPTQDKQPARSPESAFAAIAAAPEVVAPPWVAEPQVMASAHPESEPFLESEATPAPPRDAAQTAAASPPPVPATAFLASVATDPMDPVQTALPAEAVVQPSFVRTRPRRSVVRTLLLSLLSLFLLLLLAGQVVLQERDRLASWMPAWRPPLQQACAYLGCRITALRQIDALVIESSEFNSLRDGLYRFGAVIRNQADWPLATPAIELTLTDLHGRTTLRKVILPAEVAGAPQTIPARGEWTLAAGAEVNVEPRRVAGYRALLFYP